MRHVAAAGLLALALGIGAAPGLAQETGVRVQDGLVSATFNATPAPEAIDAIRRATGVEIVVPPSVQGKKVTLGVQRLAFELFLRRFLEALDLGGFALVYEPGGGAGRLIVVERGRGSPPPAKGEAPPRDTASPPAAQPEAGAAPAGPVYIPPREPPVYIPPRTPPVYIPPATPPVYVPPATPPVAPSQ